VNKAGVGRLLKIALLSVFLVAAVIAGLAFLALRQTFPPLPAMSGTIERGTLDHGGRARSWVAYVPAKPAPRPALVIVLHGSMGSGEQVRKYFGYDFDLLADRHGFIAAYPQGVGGHWNDSRRVGQFTAKRENIDDVGFLQALVERLVKERQVDPSRVFITGASNGGAMALRVAMQAPELARAYAVLLSSVPTPENMAVTPKHLPVSILLMGGTDDPVVPWGGGEVALHGVLVNRGSVLSAQASVDYFRKLADLPSAPQVTLFADHDPGDGSTVQRSSWSAPGMRSVALYTVHGGGHGVPHPAMYGMRLLGRSNRDIHAAEEIWEFFRSAP